MEKITRSELRAIIFFDLPGNRHGKGQVSWKMVKDPDLVWKNGGGKLRERRVGIQRSASTLGGFYPFPEGTNPKEYSSPPISMTLSLSLAFLSLSLSLSSIFFPITHLFYLIKRNKKMTVLPRTRWGPLDSDRDVLLLQWSYHNSQAFCLFQRFDIILNPLKLWVPLRLQCLMAAS